MKATLAPSSVVDSGKVKIGSGNIQDLRVTLAPRTIKDKGTVKLGSGNIQDLRRG